MKRFLILLSMLCFGAYADTINLHFVNEDNTTYENKTCTVGGDITLPTTAPTKRGYNFVGWKVPQYIPIEYLENDPGKTYVNTGYIANSETKILVDYILAGNYTENCPIISSSSFGINHGCVGCWATATNITYVFGSSRGSPKVEASTVGRRLVVLGKEGLYINGEYKNSVYQDQAFRSSAFSVFASSKCLLRIYSFQIYQNDILVHDYVPALDLSGVACLYDKVDNEFLYNEGTGEFVAGPIIDYD